MRCYYIPGFYNKSLLHKFKYLLKLFIAKLLQCSKSIQAQSKVCCRTVEKSNKRIYTTKQIAFIFIIQFGRQ